MSAISTFRAPSPCFRALRRCQPPRATSSGLSPVTACLGGDSGASKPVSTGETLLGKGFLGLPRRQRKCTQKGSPETSTGGGGAGGPRLPPPRSGGGAGGADWGGMPAEPSDESEGVKGIRWQGWQDRVNADPQFVFKVLVEQFIGVGAAVIGDMSTRPNWGLNELDFVFSTLVVGSIMNFVLMYLLAPAGKASAGSSGNIIAKLFDPRTLLKMGAPGGHIFEPGFTMIGRAKNLAFKTFTFGLLGFMAGIFGTGTSNGLIKIRQMLDKDFVTQNETPDILLNSSAWTLHMGLSSNIRYQALNGLDMVLVGVMPPAVFKIFVLMIRTANNIVGGMSFVMFARLVGSQKSNPGVEA